ncbi:PAS domain-containing sensor histidine kinase [Pontibacter sp. G13]|uniref:PAS domain-containing sensor histidine kinase n=1 Tax=Pontibacter sp. G13 TaxID=3074898 RepID=UPI00288C1473|nr:PAS domain-containing sensor histidine kinase [Pontibacter sp. G13]WNJ20626.1 PAS domain-containing sensor histidine kinase [Pontibacter sp. G13]
MKGLSSNWNLSLHQTKPTDLTAAQEQRIRIINQASIIGIGVEMIQIMFFAWHGDGWTTALLGFNLLLLLSVILLNRRGRRKVARFMLVFGAGLMVITHVTLLGYEHGRFLVLLLMLSLSLWVSWVKRGPWVLGALVAFMLGAIGLLFWWDSPTIRTRPLPALLVDILYLVNISMVVGVLTLVVQGLQRYTSQMVDHMAQRTRNQLIAAFEHAFDGILLVEAHTMKVHFHNRRTAELFTMPPGKDWLNKDVRTLKWEDHPNRMSEWQQITFVESPKLTEVQFTTLEGIPFWGAVAISPFEFEGKELLLVRITDITSLKRSQEQLIAAKEKAERTSHALEELVLNMNHEIRTPLNGMIGLAEIIDEEASEDHLKPYLDMLVDSSNRLLGTLASVLEMSSLESRAYQPTLRFEDVRPKIRSLLETYEQRFESREEILFQWELKGLEFPLGIDMELFLQVLDSLLSNSFKFTEAGKVSLKISRTKMDIGSFGLDVWLVDTGVGMSRQFLKSGAFEKFRQESSGQARKYEGVGLGLSIVHEILSLCGGHINIESEPGKGTTVHLQYPVHNLYEYEGQSMEHSKVYKS